MNKKTFLLATRRLVINLTALLVLSALAVSCSDVSDETEPGNPLPEGKYPVEFSSATYNLEVGTRAVTEDNTWKGGEEVAVSFGTQGVKKYTVTADGTLTATDGVTPFSWTSTGESQTVTAWYNPKSSPATQPSTFTVQANQNTATSYANSDLIMACQTVKFADASKQLTFRHLMAKVTINLTANESINNLSAAIVKLTNVNIISGTITATTSSISVTPAAPDNRPITPLRTALGSDNKTATYQALLPPQNVSGLEFIKITVSGIPYTYTPKTGDGLFETGRGYTYNIIVNKKDGLIVTIPGDNEWTSEGDEEI